MNTRKSIMKQLFSGILLIGAVFATSACHYQKYNKAQQADVREGQEYIYGEDSLARQSKVTYPAQPELDKRTAKIREKLFGQGNSELTN